jgi:hypothetical protein
VACRKRFKGSEKSLTKLVPGAISSRKRQNLLVSASSLRKRRRDDLRERSAIRGRSESDTSDGEVRDFAPGGALASQGISKRSTELGRSEKRKFPSQCLRRHASEKCETTNAKRLTSKNTNEQNYRRSYHHAPIVL